MVKVKDISNANNFNNFGKQMISNNSKKQNEKLKINKTFEKSRLKKKENPRSFSKDNIMVNDNLFNYNVENKKSSTNVNSMRKNENNSVLDFIDPKDYILAYKDLTTKSMKKESNKTPSTSKSNISFNNAIVKLDNKSVNEKSKPKVKYNLPNPNVFQSIPNLNDERIFRKRNKKEKENLENSKSNFSNLIHYRNTEACHKSSNSLNNSNYNSQSNSKEKKGKYNKNYYFLAKNININSVNNASSNSSKKYKKDKNENTMNNRTISKGNKSEKRNLKDEKIIEINSKNSPMKEAKYEQINKISKSKSKSKSKGINHTITEYKNKSFKGHMNFSEKISMKMYNQSNNNQNKTMNYEEKDLFIRNSDKKPTSKTVFNNNENKILSSFNKENFKIEENNLKNNLINISDKVYERNNLKKESLKHFNKDIFSNLINNKKINRVKIMINNDSKNQDISKSKMISQELDSKSKSINKSFNTNNLSNAIKNTGNNLEIFIKNKEKLQSSNINNDGNSIETVINVKGNINENVNTTQIKNNYKDKYFVNNKNPISEKEQNLFIEKNNFITTNPTYSTIEANDKSTIIEKDKNISIQHLLTEINELKNKLKLEQLKNTDLQLLVDEKDKKINELEKEKNDQNNKTYEKIQNYNFKQLKREFNLVEEENTLLRIENKKLNNELSMFKSKEVKIMKVLFDLSLTGIPIKEMIETQNSIPHNIPSEMIEKSNIFQESFVSKSSLKSTESILYYPIYIEKGNNNINPKNVPKINLDSINNEFNYEFNDNINNFGIDRNHNINIQENFILNSKEKEIYEAYKKINLRNTQN